mmetsp:Transcript_125979/g.368065  ORF Transcript_125979/g.368065 Transcript_125979/m.368065 type:complete len:274 (-) Transcript_125979:356-1177(-)
MPNKSQKRLCGKGRPMKRNPCQTLPACQAAHTCITASCFACTDAIPSPTTENLSNKYSMASMLVAGCFGAPGYIRLCPGTSSPRPAIKQRSTTMPAGHPASASQRVVAVTKVCAGPPVHPLRRPKRAKVPLTEGKQPSSAVPQKERKDRGLPGLQPRRSRCPDMAATPRKESEASQARRCAIMEPMENPRAKVRDPSTQAPRVRSRTIVLASSTSSTAPSVGGALRPVFQQQGLSMSAHLASGQAAQHASSQPLGQQMGLGSVALVPKGRART